MTSLVAGSAWRLQESACGCASLEANRDPAQLKIVNEPAPGRDTSVSIRLARSNGYLAGHGVVESKSNVTPG